VDFWLRTNDFILHPASLWDLMLFDLFLNQEAIKVRRHDDVSSIQGKSWGTLAQF
jgi:hypothetical protein